MSDITQNVCLGWFRAGFQEWEQISQASWGLASGLLEYHFHHILLAKAKHKINSDLMVDTRPHLLMGGAAKSHYKGSGCREGNHLYYICNLSTILCLIHSKLALEDIFTRITTPLREVMVISVNIIKTFFYHIWEKWLNFLREKQSHWSLCFLSWVLFPDKRKLRFKTSLLPNLEKLSSPEVGMD